VLFNREGQVVETKQLADGTPSTVADYVASMAMKHGKALRDLVDESTKEN